jgi:cyclopropane fatty-acyl-phospholipid synthase-like methyltransferase
MKQTKAELAALLALEDFPRSAAYDPLWMLENTMGPNAVWLTEALMQEMDLSVGMRVMDLGCGKAISSLFLSLEFGLQVWATDWWVSANDNWQRICAANMQRQVFPIHAEAHALPFAHGFFDALISIDAYHYFGTDDLYLGYISQFVRPGGTIAIVVPGVLNTTSSELPAEPPSHWPWEWGCFHSPDWWREHWEKTGLVEVERADTLADGWKHWLKWLQVCLDTGSFSAPEEIEILRTDAGRTLGFTRLIAHKR